MTTIKKFRHKAQLGALASKRALKFQAMPSRELQASFVDAYRNKSLEDFKAALAAGANPNGMGDYQKPLLAWAAQNGDGIFVRALLEAGGRPCAAALNAACLMFDHNDDATAEGSAAWMVKAFIQAGVDPSGVEGGDKSPLAICLDRKRWSSAWALIDAGASLGAEDRESQTALSSAIVWQCSRSVELLAQAGVSDPKWGVDWKSMKALAQKSGSEKMSQMIFALIEKGDLEAQARGSGEIEGKVVRRLRV